MSSHNQQQQQQQQQPAEINVGASDTLLLAVSIFGFIVLAVSVYSIIIMRLKTADEVAADGDDGTQKLSYEERLANCSDVSKLNRAQRRARAKHIMKQQRRIVAPAATTAMPGGGGNEENNNNNNNEDDGNNNNNNNNNDNMQLQLANVDDDADDANNNAAFGLPQHQQQHLSRKERQKAAKAQEKEERKLFEEDRRKQQLVQQQEAHREKLMKQQQHQQELEKQRKQRLEDTQREELASYHKWKTFLASPEDPTKKTISVKNWIDEELSLNRRVNIVELAKRFDTSTNVVQTRIQELINEFRLTGYFFVDDENENENDDQSNTVIYFVYVPKQELATLSSFIQTKDFVTLQEISKAYEEITFLK